MKKALSVLLVAAAIFGFYGSAVNVNDILACKDYWEEAGEKSTADMNKLEDGLNQLKENEQAYLDGQDQIVEGEQALADGEAQYAAGLKSYEEAPAKLASGREGLKSLRKAIKGINDLKDPTSGYKAVWKAGYNALHENRQKLVAGLDTPADPETGATVKQILLGSVAPQLGDSQEAFEKAVNSLNDNGQFAKDYKNFAKNGRVVAAGIDGAIDAAEKAKAQVDGLIDSCNTKTQFPGMGEIPTIQAGLLNPQTAAATEAGIRGVLAKAEQSDQADTLVAGAKTGDQEAIGTIAYIAGLVSAGAEDSINGLKSLKSLYTDNLVAYADAVDENVDKLEEGQNDTIADGVRQLVSGILGDKTMRNKLIKKVGRSKVNAMKKYGTRKSPLYTKNGCDFAEFEKRMDTSPDVMTFLSKALPIVKQRLEDGKKEYAAGLQSYKEAPAKLADAEQQLADGRQALEDGKAQLAQYEDGEQQVRDGLASLVGTEPDLELESIADRLNGDTDFDNGDEHLDLDEGLNAVEVGRGYQADDGVLITEEIMGRAVATGGLLAAGVLAVIAAILSFLKKNKGAGVFALLAAAAGAFGAFYGTQAGTYFSSIAGSAVGATAWVAAGILGGVALVHAIVHFAAPKTVA